VRDDRNPDLIAAGQRQRVAEAVALLARRGTAPATPEPQGESP